MHLAGRPRSRLIQVSGKPGEVGLLIRNVRVPSPREVARLRPVLEHWEKLPPATETHRFDPTKPI